MAVAIADVPNPTPYAVAYEVVAGLDGHLWFTSESGVADVGSAIVEVDPSSREVTAYPLSVPSFYPVGPITITPDGKIWFASSQGAGPGTDSYLGVIDPATHAITQFTLPASTSDARSLILGIAATPDGNLWYTQADPLEIGMFDPKTQTFAHYPTPGLSGFPHYITVGSDGALWFNQDHAIGRLDPTTHEVILIPFEGNTQLDQGIAAGPDGNLWFAGTRDQVDPTTGYRGGFLGRVNPTTHAIDEFSIPSPAPGKNPRKITTGSDGNLWFTFGYNADAIGVINPTTLAVTQFRTPSLQSPVGIVSGPDGHLWLTAYPLGDVTILPDSVIAGTAYRDLNANGSLDIRDRLIDRFNSVYITANEPALPGRTVYLDLDGNGKLDAGEPSGLTDASGNYQLASAGPGTYTVRMVTHPGEVETAATVTVADGVVTPFANPGLLPPGSIAGLTRVADPFGSDNPDTATAEVVGLYRTILGRAPDAPGLASWVADLAGGMSLDRVASGFTRSTEYETNVVASYYRDDLGRAGSTAEIASWVAAIDGGLSLEEVSARFLDSPEYGRLNAADAGFVQSLYDHVLARVGSSSEVNGWIDAIETSGWTRDEVARYFLASEESDTRAIDDLYATFLGRVGEPSGVAAALARLEDDSFTLLDLATYLAGSLEYARRAKASLG